MDVRNDYSIWIDGVCPRACMCAWDIQGHIHLYDFYCKTSGHFTERKCKKMTSLHTSFGSKITLAPHHAIMQVYTCQGLTRVQLFQKVKSVLFQGSGLAVLIAKLAHHIDSWSSFSSWVATARCAGWLVSSQVIVLSLWVCRHTQRLGSRSGSM